MICSINFDTKEIIKGVNASRDCTLPVSWKDDHDIKVCGQEDYERLIKKGYKSINQ